MTSSFSVVTANANYPGSLVVAGNPDVPQTVLIYNNDSTVPIFLADVNSINAGDINNSTPLLPKSSVTFDGTVDIYASTLTGQTAQLYIFPSGSSYSQGFGVTPLTQQGSIPPGSGANLIGKFYVQVLDLVDISNFSSYDLSAFFYDTSGATSSVRIVLQWFDDQVSGIPVAEEDWWVWVSNSATFPATAFPLMGSGPMHGRYMSVYIDNSNGNSSVEMQYLNIFGSPRTMTFSDWRSNPMIQSGPGGGTDLAGQNTIGSGFDNILGGVSGFTMPLAGNFYFNLGLYAGPAYFSITIGPNALAKNIVLAVANNNKRFNGGGGAESNTLTDFPAIGVANYNTLPSSGPGPGNIILPRSACALIFTGNTSAASTISFMVVGQQNA